MLSFGFRIDLKVLDFVVISTLRNSDIVVYARKTFLYVVRASLPANGVMPVIISCTSTAVLAWLIASTLALLL